MWNIFLALGGLFFFYLIWNITKEYTKDLKGWIKVIVFPLIFILVFLVFMLFSGHVPEWGR